MADLASGEKKKEGKIWLVGIEILDDLTMKRVGPSPCKAAAAVNLVSHVSLTFK